MEMRDNGNPKARMVEALNLIQTSFTDPELRPSMIARQVDLDLPAFSRAFKQVTGYTCTRFITLARLSAAKRMLSQDSLLVKEIAYRVGFESPNYFSRRFREVEGRTPTSYRKLNLLGAYLLKPKI
jgi:two-component system response regulator YesN